MAIPNAASTSSFTSGAMKRAPHPWSATGEGDRRRARAAALCVLAAHKFVVWALLQNRIVRLRPEVPVTVSIIESPKRERPLDLFKPPQLAPMKAHLVFVAPTLPDMPDATEPSESPAPISESTAPSAAPATTARVALTQELAVFCPERKPPAYPAQSRHLREQGEVTLRVDLDETGRVSAVTVLKSSGSARLDDAARAAVLTWRCTAPRRDGQAVRAVAIQSLEFVLERR